MTIGNDSFTIGTAATAAGVANVGYQNRTAIRNSVAKIFKKDTVEVAKKAKTKTNAKNVAAKATATAKKAKTKANAKTNVKFTEKLASMASAAGKGIKKGFTTAKNTVVDSSKSLWNKSGKFFRGTNWKTVGKYAGVGAGVAAVLVAAKNIFFSSNNEEI